MSKNTIRTILAVALGMGGYWLVNSIFCNSRPAPAPLPAPLAAEEITVRSIGLQAARQYIPEYLNYHWATFPKESIILIPTDSPGNWLVAGTVKWRKPDGLWDTTSRWGVHVGRNRNGELVAGEIMLEGRYVRRL